MTARAIASVALGLWLTLLVMPMGGVAHAGERVCGNGIIQAGESFADGNWHYLVYRILENKEKW